MNLIFDDFDNSRLDADSITAVPPDVDLVLDSVTTETTEALFGNNLEIRWGVRNQGTEATTTSWRDRIYLSTDETLSDDDISLGVFSTPNSQLAPGTTYSQTAVFNLVNLPDPGLSYENYYVLLETDEGNTQDEINTDNNLSSGSLSDNSDEFTGASYVDGNATLESDDEVTVTFNVWRDGKHDDIGEIDLSEETYLIVHGFAGGAPNAESNFTFPEGGSKWMGDMAAAIHKDDPGANVVLVDWSKGAAPMGLGNLINNLPEYQNAVSSALNVGDEIARYLTNLDPSRVTLIGHSLGGHVVGDAGYEYTQLTGGQKINTIIGLDPAGPTFEQSLSKSPGFEDTLRILDILNVEIPKNRDLSQDPNSRLTQDDAQNVIVIHTSNILGFKQPLGTLDLYINPERDDTGDIQDYDHPHITDDLDILDPDAHTYAHEILTRLFYGAPPQPPQSNFDRFIHDKLTLESLRDPSFYQVDDRIHGTAGNVRDFFELPEDTNSQPIPNPPEDTNSQPIPNPPEGTTRSKGEPHLTTFDGIGYNFQGAGEFTLVESLNDDFNVQVRYVEIDPTATVASAVATIVDGQRVEIDSEGIEFVEGRPIVTRSTSGGTATVSIDGEVVEIPDNGDRDIGSSKIYRRGGQYTIVYAGENGTIEDGDDQLVVNYMRPGTINIVDVFLGDEKKGQVQGLGGNLNDNPEDDVALPDGTPLARPLQFSELYGDYREAWRVKDARESLFDYEPGQSPDTFYNPNFPATPFGYNDLDPGVRANADAAALAAGYTPGTFEFESAAFDFAITNDPGFLEGADTDPGADESLSIVDDRPDRVTQRPNFTGAEVELQIFYPDLQSPLAEPLIVTVSDEVEASSSDFNVGNLVDDRLDIRSNSIVYEIGPSAGSGNSASGSFNGYVINDVFDILPDFTNVSINEANNTMRLEPNDVTFTENTIYINFESLSYSPGQTVELDIDFAEIALGNSAIEGLVFDDRNANSIQDIGETGLAGVTVFLDENQNGQFDPDEPSQATDSSGEYRFTGLVPGSYNVRQITPSGYEQTYPFTQTSIGDGFADRVLDYFDSGAGPQPGPYGSGGVNFTENVVLGDSPTTFLSLPTGSSVTVSFEDEVIINGPGDDIFILEEGSAREEAHVYVSSDLTTFTLLGIADGGTTTSLDLEDINFNQPVRAVKIVGLDNSGRSPGFDVASVRGLPDSIIMAPDFHGVSLQPGETVSSLNFGNSAVADGSFIQPDTAVASSEFSSRFQATYTIDGSGLSDPLLGSNAIHDPYSSDNHWTSAGTAPRDQLIDWGFTTPQNLDEIYIWNHQSTVGPVGPAANPGYDVTLFDLTLFDAADNILLTLDDVALQPDTNAAQTFSFGQTVANVSRVRFEIEDVQSSTNYTGLAEVGFRGV